MRQNKNNRKKKWLFPATAGLCFLGILFVLCYPRGRLITKKQLDSMELEKIKNLMIVAHPDDETFWGGAHIRKENYLVVCITNGTSNIRKREFIQAVTLAKSVPLILNYPDKQFGIRSRWFGHQKRIQKDLEVLLSYKDWEKVVTHNPDGEYGHIHHKKTSALVTVALREKPEIELFYFGSYFTKDSLQERAEQKKDSISEEELQKKWQMVECYSSQEKAIHLFSHMFPYENWISAKDWEEENH